MTSRLLATCPHCASPVDVNEHVDRLQAHLPFTCPHCRELVRVAVVQDPADPKGGAWALVDNGYALAPPPTSLLAAVAELHLAARALLEAVIREARLAELVRWLARRLS